MRLVDTHCHLQDAAFDDDREEVIARALETLEWLVVIGDDLDSSARGVALTRNRVYAAVGIHPYHAANMNDDSLAQLRAWASLEHVVALGEFGLDYYTYCHTPRDVQHAAFHAQLALAEELRLPVIIHNREADDDVAAIIGEHAARLRGGIMHCFAGDAAYAERSMAWGFHISFAGNVTFPKAAALREAACAVPLERLLVETDSPYLAPQAHRGKRCEPEYVRYAAAALAELKGVTPKELAKQTTENARRLFGVMT